MPPLSRIVHQYVDSWRARHIFIGRRLAQLRSRSTCDQLQKEGGRGGGKMEFRETSRDLVAKRRRAKRAAQVAGGGGVTASTTDLEGLHGVVRN